jgi:hypothetical protein
VPIFADAWQELIEMPNTKSKAAIIEYFFIEDIFGCYEKKQCHGAAFLWQALLFFFTTFIKGDNAFFRLM